MREVMSVPLRVGLCPALCQVVYFLWLWFSAIAIWTKDRASGQVQLLQPGLCPIYSSRKPFNVFLKCYLPSNFSHLAAINSIIYCMDIIILVQLWHSSSWLIAQRILHIAHFFVQNFKLLKIQFSKTHFFHKRSIS